MTDLEESWARTTAFLLRAVSFTQNLDLSRYREYLEHNELELAADELEAAGDQHGRLPRDFWTHLRYAYEEMDLKDRAKLCWFRMREAEEGYVEARLTLLDTSQGGRSSPAFIDYRPDWDIGNRTETGDRTINGAAITIEDGPSIQPAGTGTVRLHPTCPEAWRHLHVGAEINMHEGSRVLGKAIVLRVSLGNIRA